MLLVIYAHLEGAGDRHLLEGSYEPSRLILLRVTKLSITAIFSEDRPNECRFSGMNSTLEDRRSVLTLFENVESSCRLLSSPCLELLNWEFLLFVSQKGLPGVFLVDRLPFFCLTVAMELNFRSFLVVPPIGEVR